MAVGSLKSKISMIKPYREIFCKGIGMGIGSGSDSGTAFRLARRLSVRLSTKSLPQTLLLGITNTIDCIQAECDLDARA
jgi:hypothetical protein